MSQNKTVIPGLENAAQSSQGVQSGATSYAPYDGKTVVPGITQGNSASTVVVNNKPIVGFLYSISRTGYGEFWPLRVGPNSIGRSKNCDIYLPEGTVSEQHAEFVIHLMKNPEKVSAAIYDQRSTCGTMINGESLGFEPRECVNGDIITIGDHYDLFVILVDVKKLGLKVCDAFIPVDVEQFNPSVQQQVPNGGGHTQIYNSQYSGTPTQQQPVPPTFQPGRTVGADTGANGNNQRTEPGKTIFM